MQCAGGQRYGLRFAPAPVPRRPGAPIILPPTRTPLDAPESFPAPSEKNFADVNNHGYANCVMAGELMIAFTNPPTKTVPTHIRDLESPLCALYLYNTNKKLIF